jgi:hypothetical protein
MEAQGLLNRSGAILDPDGNFGGETVDAVCEFQAGRGIPVTGIVDAVTWRELRAQGEPSREIPTRAVAFIAREEVGSRRLYDTNPRPGWPGGASGVTIGAGYDLGYQPTFEADWAGLLTFSQKTVLKQWVGIRGLDASAGPAALTGIAIPWTTAWTVFIGRSLPQSVSETRNAFYGSMNMPRLCFGALVSLVYNRGSSMIDSVDHPGNRKEMRDIRDAVAIGRFSAIPALLRSMKRLWPEPNALRDRREREAKLFEIGLAGG